MKKFLRSIPGKAISFVICVLSAIVLTASIVGIFAMAVSDIYETPKSEMIEQFERNAVSNYLRQFFEINLEVITENNAEYGISKTSDDTRIVISDASGKQILDSDYFLDVSSYKHRKIYECILEIDNRFEIFEVPGDSKQWPNDGKIYLVDMYYQSVGELDETISFELQIVELAYRFEYLIYVVLLIAAVLTIATYITLISVSARKPESEEIIPGPFHKVPFDLMLATVVFSLVTTFFLVIDSNGLIFAIAATTWTIVAFCSFLALSMSFAARVKAKTIISNNLIAIVLKLVLKILKTIAGFIKTVFMGIPLVIRGVLVLFGITFVDLLFLMFNSYEADNIFAYFIITRIIFLPVFIYALILIKRLVLAGSKISKGETDYKVDSKGMFGDFKIHAENLNSISDGINIAVQEKVKSERMKTELITNVSHDIKTPLTSIINYAGLIANEKTDNSNIIEYSEVLVRQSEKLKRLIEDLVEASKASTGNLEVELTKLDAVTLVNQIDGEYDEKLHDANLTLFTTVPEESIYVMADGRRMWRVFDNLMNNICKYSQPGTRVYISLEEDRNESKITFKNTSKEPLNITPDELIERFVRGDSSRNTEGNGLGLSIAKSLVELQGGSFKLDIDGDLFKVSISIPKA